MHEFKEQERKYAGFQMCVRAVWRLELLEKEKYKSMKLAKQFNLSLYYSGVTNGMITYNIHPSIPIHFDLTIRRDQMKIQLASPKIFFKLGLH